MTGGKNGQAIDAAIAKYGKDNFTYEVLERCPKEILLDRELFWAEEVFNGECYAPIGYNIIRAGYGGIRINHISCYDMNGNIVKTYLNSNDAGRSIGVTGVAIRQAEKSGGTCAGYMWRYGNDEKIDPFVKKRGGTQIRCYDKNGGLSMTFQNGVEAAEFFGVSPSAISAFATHKPGYRLCKGYYLAKGDNPPVIRDVVHNSYCVQCYEYDVDTRAIKHGYRSIREAANGRDSKPIRNALNGVQHKAYGSLWSYNKYDSLPTFET